MFIPLPPPESPEDSASWIFLFDRTGLIIDPETGQVPMLEMHRALARNGLHPFETLYGTLCCCGTLEELPESGSSILNLRTFYHSADEAFRLAVTWGRFIADLHTNNRFCGRCGTLTRMIGFTAEYESGKIKIDPKEILAAEWFKADQLPLIPDSYTLAGKLIRDFKTKLNKS